MKRVLYALEDYPVSSETYVETEMRFFLEQGVEIAAWSRRQDPARSQGSVPVFTGSLKDAVRQFQPSVIHAHWLLMAPVVLVENFGLPFTIRGHSFEFKPRAAKTLAFDSRVRALFLFPHQFEETFRGGPAGSAIPLRCAYDDRLFYPGPKELGTVVRATAGLRSKDIDSFLDTAKACPEAKFTLITSRPKEDVGYLDNLLAKNQAMGHPAEILVELSQADVATIVRKSQICLRSNNPTGHPFGMPASIAEAMGAGTIPVVRNHAAAKAYVGDAGFFFDTIDDAVRVIRLIIDDAVLAGELREVAIGRAQRHAAGVVLPKILEVWERVSGW